MTTHMTLTDKTGNEREVLVDFCYESPEPAEYEGGGCVYPGCDADAEIVSMVFSDTGENAMSLYDMHEGDIRAHCVEEYQDEMSDCPD